MQKLDFNPAPCYTGAEGVGLVPWELHGVYYEAAEAAEIAGVGYSTMTLACRKKEVPGAVGFADKGRGTIWLIPEAGLRAWMAAPRTRRGRPRKAKQPAPED